MEGGIAKGVGSDCINTTWWWPKILAETCRNVDQYNYRRIIYIVRDWNWTQDPSRLICKIAYAEWLPFLRYIRNILLSNLCAETSHHYWGLSRFSSCSPNKCMDYISKEPKSVSIYMTAKSFFTNVPALRCYMDWSQDWMQKASK
jgi:hypothetical protein